MGLFNKIEDGARTLFWGADGSRTVLAMIYDARSRRRKVIGGAVFVVVALGGGGFAYSRYAGSKSTEQIGVSWNALHACLLGDALAQGEKPSMRFRGMQLTAMTQAEVSRVAAGGEPWPERCAKPSYELREALVAASKAQEGKKDLASWSEKLATALKSDLAFQQDLSEVLDQTWDAAAKEGLKAGSPPIAPTKPPAPAAPLTVDAFSSGMPFIKTSIDLAGLGLESHPATAVRFLIEDKDGSDRYQLCAISPTTAAAKCGSLPASVLASPVGLQLLGTAEDDSDPLVFAGRKGSEGVFRSGSGEKIGAASSLGGYAAKDGFSAILAYDEAGRRLEFFRKAGSAAAQRLPVTVELKPNDPTRDAQLLWGRLVYRGSNSFHEMWLGSLDVRGTGAKASQIGLLAEGGPAQPESADAAPEISGCKSSGATVVRVRGKQSEFLSFFVGERWTKPVQVVGVGGTLNCRKAEASITRVDVPKTEGMLRTVITQHRCTPAACTTETITLGDLLKGELALAPVASVIAAELDGKVVVVWSGADRGGLRMRVAPMREIANAPDVIVLDDLVKDGAVQKTSTLSEVRLVSREKHAVLFLSTSKGTYALRIERDGTFAPIKVTRE